MSTYHFSADRQLFFYVNVAGQQRLVRFGERNSFGASEFRTQLRETAEAIRRHSLYKRGVIREMVSEEEAAKAVGARVRAAVVTSDTAARADGDARVRTAVDTAGTAAGADGETAVTAAKEVIEARNFTQAKSLLAKRLEIAYSDIKTPDQLLQKAKEAGIEIVYNK